MDIVIIEDEPEILETLISIVNNYLPDISILGTATNNTEAFNCLTINPPDVILSDINIGNNTIFEVLEKIENIKFKVVFITAHEEYALKAIKLSAIDYLLKPVDPLELIATLNKIKQNLNSDAEQEQALILHNNLQKDKPKKIVLKTAERIHIIDTSDIMHIEADGSYSTFYLSNGKSVIVSKLIKEYDTLLSEYCFFRTHQSHLVNLNQVSSYEKNDGGFLLMKNNKQVPVSQRKREHLLCALEKL